MTSSTLLQLLGLFVLTACATGEPVNQVPKTGDAEMHDALGCLVDEVAVCVSSNCDPEDFACVEKGELRGLFEPRIKR